MIARVLFEKDRESWILEEDGVVYSLVSLEVPPEKDPGVRKKVELSLFSVAEMRSLQNLLLYAAGTSYPKERYPHSEAVAEALISLRRDLSPQGSAFAGKSD